MATTTPRRTRPQVPGPGAFDLPSMFSGPAALSNMGTQPTFSIPSGRSEGTPRDDRVGPGRYEPQWGIGHKASPNYGFNKQQRHLSQPAKSAMATPTPGPEIRNDVKFQRSPCYGFGTEKRATEADDKKNEAAEKKKGLHRTPGPGSHDPDYDKLSVTKRSPVFSVAPRRDGLSDSDKEKKKESSLVSPGPGHYLEKNEKIMKTQKFGLASRFVTTNEKKLTPGPGTYCPIVTETGGGCVGSAQKWSMTGRGITVIEEATMQF